MTKLKYIWIAIKNKYFFWKHRNDKMCRIRFPHDCDICNPEEWSKLRKKYGIARR